MDCGAPHGVEALGNILSFLGAPFAPRHRIGPCLDAFIQGGALNLNGQAWAVAPKKRRDRATVGSADQDWVRQLGDGCTQSLNLNAKHGVFLLVGDVDQIRKGPRQSKFSNEVVGLFDVLATAIQVDANQGTTRAFCDVDGDPFPGAQCAAGDHQGDWPLQR